MDLNNKRIERLIGKITTTLEDIESAYKDTVSTCGKLKSENEELELANEELQEENEELESANEELREENEELESANEEFESDNQELQDAICIARKYYVASQKEISFLIYQISLRHNTLPLKGHFLDINGLVPENDPYKGKYEYTEESSKLCSFAKYL